MSQENLLVVVIPKDGIVGTISVEDMVLHDKAKLYSVPGYFYSQNEGDLDYPHYSFLIDKSKNENITGKIN